MELKTEKFLLVGSGSREAAFALKLFATCELYAIMSHENPTIARCVASSGGKFKIANASSPEVVLDFALKYKPDYVFVSADEPLANGVIDCLLENNIKAVGGTKQACRIEWDKIYSIEMMAKVCPQFTPFFRVITNLDELDSAIEQFRTRRLELVVKPQGLTGGKGVKVMPIHLSDFAVARQYAQELLTKAPNEKVLLVEKLEGVEFTIMGLTDGKNVVLSPATYDYPYRFDNDLGPGTGGMGCFTNNESKLPFMSAKDWSDCQFILQQIIHEMYKLGLNFNGVLNGGFFKTEQGIKFMEFNSRFGDPEGLNIMMSMRSSLKDLIKDMWYKKLTNNSLVFGNQATIVKYLVAKEYPKASKVTIDFELDEKAIAEMGVQVFFGACVESGTSNSGKSFYQTLKSSRVLALGTSASTIEVASKKINVAINKYVKGKLEFREDIGSSASLHKIATQIAR